MIAHDAAPQGGTCGRGYINGNATILAPLLVRCHAGCDEGQIVAEIGLGLRALFPRDHSARATPRHSQRARHWHAITEAVQTLHQEYLVCAIAADDIAADQPITPQDAPRVAECAERIRAGIEACT